MIDRDEFSAWLRLLETPGVGRQSARALLARFGAPEAAIAASKEARREVVGAAVAAALAQAPDEFAARSAAAWQWLTSGGDEPRDAIVVGDPRYPQLLLDSAAHALTRNRVAPISRQHACRCAQADAARGALQLLHSARLHPTRSKWNPCNNGAADRYPPRRCASSPSPGRGRSS